MSKQNQTRIFDAKENRVYALEKELLDNAISTKSRCIIFLSNGVRLEAIIYGYDENIIHASYESQDPTRQRQIIYKNQVTTISFPVGFDED